MADKVIVCFSATGNSYYVAKALCAKLGYDEVLLGPEVLDDPELLGNPVEIGLVFPTYSGHPCQNLGAFMYQVLADEKYDRLEFLFAITTCGGFPGHSLKIAEQLAMEANVICSYMDWVKMPDTYAPMFAIPSDDEVRQAIGRADVRIDEIAQKILKGDFGIPGRKWFTKMAYNRYKKACQAEGIPMVRVNSGSCVGCGHCVAVCPRDAIEIVDGKPQFSGNCENCLACFHFCPNHAIELDKVPKKGYSYYKQVFTGYQPDYRK